MSITQLAIVEEVQPLHVEAEPMQVDGTEAGDCQNVSLGMMWR